MRKIPIKNYILLLFIILVTVLISLYIVLLHNKNKQKDNVLNDTIYEIIPSNKNNVPQEFDNYLVENENLIVYISYSDKQILNFEKSFKEYLIDKKLEKQIVYINSNNINIKKFIPDLFTKYEYKNNLDLNPIIIIFKDKKIKDVYSSQFDIELVSQFFVRNEVFK